MLLCARLRERSAGVPTIGLRWEIRLWDKSSSSWDLGFSGWEGSPEVETTLGEESKVFSLLQMQNEYVENGSRSSLWEDWGQDSLAWTSSESLISNDFKSVSPALAGQWDRWSGWSGCCRPWGWSGRVGWTRGCPRRSTWGWLLSDNLVMRPGDNNRNNPWWKVLIWTQHELSTFPNFMTRKSASICIDQLYVCWDIL